MHRPADDTSQASEDRSRWVDAAFISLSVILVVVWFVGGGEEPSPAEGDIVKFASNYDGDGTHNKEFEVAGAITEKLDGLPYTSLTLMAVEGTEHHHFVDEQYVTIVERAEPDERMPLRYGLTKIEIVVAFNNIPSP